MLKVLRTFVIVLLFVGATVVGVTHVIDRAADYDSPMEAYGALGGASDGIGPPQGKGRVFVLLVESLRSKSALNPDLMPYFGTLRQKGFTAELSTVDESATFGPISAAFSGRLTGCLQTVQSLYSTRPPTRICAAMAGTWSPCSRRTAP